jgi:hypothetical protein
VKNTGVATTGDAKRTKTPTGHGNRGDHYRAQTKVRDYRAPFHDTVTFGKTMVEATAIPSILKNNSAPR